MLNITYDVIQMSIAEYYTENCPKGWEHLFETARGELNHISNLLKDEKMYYPLKTDIFKVYEMMKPEDIKVVLIGQDPYPQYINIDGIGTPRAMGMSFSVKRGDSIPSSLQNIFKELLRSVNGFIPPTHGDLSRWCKQGVFLLNIALTVEPGKPDSHTQLWMGFIKKTLGHILSINPKCIYMLWGNNAKSVIPFIGKSEVLTTSHPSGFSCRMGFLGCDHFNKVNEILVKQGKKKIDWNLDDKPILKITNLPEKWATDEVVKAIPNLNH